VPPELVVEMELDPPAERDDAAAFVAKVLADELFRRLDALALSCTRVLVSAETEHGERCERLWRHEGSLTATAITDRVRWQLDGWLNGSAAARPTSGIAFLRVAPEEVVAANGRQLGFWGGETASAERAMRALARVQGLLGPDAARVPEWRGGRGPAEQVALVPAHAVDLTAERPRTRRDSVVAPWPGAVPAPAPATIHEPPVAAEVVDGQDRPLRVSGRGVASAAPARVTIGGGHPQEVQAWAGPWPVEERWWDPAANRRRARIQVVLDNGEAHLLAVEHGRWWLDATYD
jgi:protein ImuB